MAQSALTVTPPNPSPPTNMSFNGVTAPNPPNYLKTQYANVFNMSAVNSPQLVGDGRPVQTIPGVGVNQTPAPYASVVAVANAPSGPQWTSATASVLPAFKTNVAALTGGTGATSGGTEGTYPGTDTAPFDTPNMVGAVPAATSVAHEGAGTEVVVQKVTGATAADYNPAVFLPYTGSAATTTTGVTGPWQLITCSTGPALAANTMPTPNASHASSLSPGTNPAISATPATALSPATIASGTNTFALTVTGTNFTPQSVVYINGIPQATVYVSATSLTVAAALKKTTAGTFPVTVVTGGVVVTANAPVMTYT